MTSPEDSTNKNIDYRELKHHILFHKEEELIRFVKKELLLPIKEDSPVKNNKETQYLLKRFEKLLDLDEQTRTIGIARTDKMISDYENQGQLWTNLSLILTIIGILFSLVSAPKGPAIIYLIILLIPMVGLTITLISHKKKVGIAVYLKTLLESSSTNNCK